MTRSVKQPHIDTRNTIKSPKGISVHSWKAQLLRRNTSSSIGTLLERELWVFCASRIRPGLVLVASSYLDHHRSRENRVSWIGCTWDAEAVEEINFYEHLRIRYRNHSNPAVMSAVWLDPYSLMEDSTAAESRSVDSGISFARHDTPQLSPHDYRRWQYSPVRSNSPELDHRRIRRKPSIHNLTGRTAHSTFARMPSFVSPLPVHNFDLHESQLHQLHQPRTPRPRAYTASPSLSSTITTLQSTPTHTPIFRGGSFDERRTAYERNELETGITTKRKYSSVKLARKLPRQQRSEEGSGESGIFKVYAAVFDISGEGEGLSKESSSQAVPISKQARGVQFAETDILHDYDISSTSISGQSLHRRDQTGTSSFSLSKFEFPAPPNKDNWAGTLSKLPMPTADLSTNELHRLPSKVTIRHCTIPRSIIRSHQSARIASTGQT